MALLDRIPNTQTLGEFRRAARLRFAEAKRAVGADDRLIGIYLAGYAAEMTLKAAYFRVGGKKPNDPITGADLQSVKTNYKTLLGSSWPGNLHSLIPWVETLVAERQSRGIPYSMSLVNQLTWQVQQVAANWREVLRYHENRPRLSEVTATFQAVDWLLGNESRLIR